MPPTQFDISWESIRDLKLRIPPVEEQRRIADFLDTQISILNELIESRNRQIQLINSELVPSILDRFFKNLVGESMNLSWLLDKKVHDGPHTTPEFTRSGVPFLSVDNISNFSINWENVRFISEIENEKFSTKSDPKFGDILLTKSASIGKVAIVTTDSTFNVWSPIAILRVNPKLVNNYFIAWQLLSPLLQSQMMNACTHSTQNNLAMKDIEKLKLVVPSLSEQEEIDRNLRSEFDLANNQIEQITQMVDFLSEYRTSLITSVITGITPVSSGRRLV
jgi:type I restriction enzyme S subunit